MYSSQTKNDGIIANINSYDYDLECITWTTDGIYAGTCFYRKGKFSMTTHCGLLTLKPEYKKVLDYKYLYFILKNNLSNSAIGETGNKRIGTTTIKKIKISIPVNNLGTFNLILQQKLLANYTLIDNIKKTLKMEFSKFKNISLKNSTDYLSNIHNFNLIYVPLKEILNLDNMKSNPSWFTKEFINNNQGTIPVYGATANISVESYGYVKDNIEKINYFNDLLTWNIDGSLGCHLRKGRFTLSEKVIPIYIKEEYKNLINLEYLSKEILTSALKQNFNYNNKAGKSRLSKLKVKIPIKENNQFDFILQSKIVEYHNGILKVKEGVENNLNILINKKILF